MGYVLHFSDVHYDDLYVIGGIADCPDPLCCRNVSENGTLVRDLFVKKLTFLHCYSGRMELIDPMLTLCIACREVGKLPL